ncbi:hypothetical protein SDC9_207769 [bioreactor metagenome]|uniref:Uncharacterized protein n=1 Tax=bioreactor metagenome TaxID=1076179 RepID=A0A645J9E4_9ZZZZ
MVLRQVGLRAMHLARVQQRAIGCGAARHLEGAHAQQHIGLGTKGLHIAGPIALHKHPAALHGFGALAAGQHGHVDRGCSA